jgi:hypothetical protein
MGGCLQPCSKRLFQHQRWVWAKTKETFGKGSLPDLSAFSRGLTFERSIRCKIRVAIARPNRFPNATAIAVDDIRHSLAADPFPTCLHLEEGFFGEARRSKTFQEVCIPFSLYWRGFERMLKHYGMLVQELPLVGNPRRCSQVSIDSIGKPKRTD